MAEEIVLKKASQMGITAWAMNKVIWLSVNFVIVAIYTMPTGADVSDLSQGRFNPVLQYSDLDIARDVDNIGMKKIGMSFLYFRGTWTERQAISVPSDMNVHDEVDFSRPDVSDMYKERLSASPFKLKVKISTPTVPDFGISAAYNETNKKEWFVTCLKCKHQQILTEENIIDNDFRCVKCRSVLDRKIGQWRATGTGKVEGYHMSQLMSPMISAQEILQKKKDARLKKFYYNFVLGEEYAGGDDMVTRADIMACVTDINDIPAATVKTAVGVDWGDTSWAVVRRGNYILHMEQITGDTRTHPRRVAELMEKFNGYAVCDFGYGDTKNKALIEKFPKKMWQCLYTPKIIFPRFDEKKRQVDIDRTLSLSERCEEIKNKLVKIVWSPELDTFIRHFGNMVEKKTIDDHGEVKKEIERVGDDHYIHAFNYASLLFSTKQGNYGNWSVAEI